MGKAGKATETTIKAWRSNGHMVGPEHEAALAAIRAAAEAVDILNGCEDLRAKDLAVAAKYLAGLVDAARPVEVELGQLDVLLRDLGSNETATRDKT